eukprot:scaffold71791_cov22-Prasinocladus_malaysianus.AAC.1
MEYSHLDTRHKIAVVALNWRIDESAMSQYPCRCNRVFNIYPYVRPMEWLSKVGGLLGVGPESGTVRWLPAYWRMLLSGCV